VAPVLLAARAIDSLAVLPFENASKDPDAEYLGDGLTESLINQMSRVPSLRVMARATVFRFKGTADPQDAGRKLRVGAVLTGSVSRRGNRLSISAELMEISTGARLWGEKYDRPFEDLLRVQDSIASDMSDRLRLRLSGQEKSTLARHGTENAEAYALFLKGRYFVLKDTEDGYLEARRWFLQALEKDPKFAEAHMGVADTYGLSAVDGYERPGEARPRCDEEARKALELRPGFPEARASLAGTRFWFDWDWAGAERELRGLSAGGRLGVKDRVIALLLWASGRTEEAADVMEKARRADPGNLTLTIVTADYLAKGGLLKEATGLYRAAMALEPSDPRSLFGLAEVLRRRGDVEGAIDALRKAYELAGEDQGVKALAAARTEKDYDDAEVAVARFRLGDLETLAKQRYISPLDLARLHAQVGEREKAFARLEEAFAERSPGLVLLKVDRAWDRIRDDARFASLVRRVGIP
jgi:TolB-like protein